MAVNGIVQGVLSTPAKNTSTSNKNDEKYKAQTAAGYEILKKRQNSGANSIGTSTGTSTSNPYSALYTGNNFLDWYKTHYGSDYIDGQGYSRTQQMSDLDWEIGQTLHNSLRAEEELAKNYAQDRKDYEKMFSTQQSAAQAAYDNHLQSLEEAYGLSADRLNEDRSSARQEASIMRDKLMKYLPEQMKAQGLGGLGVSSSAMLEANNSYINQLGAIMEEYNRNRGELDLGHSNNLRELASNKLANDTQRNNQYMSALMSLRDAYNSDNYSLRAQAENNVKDALSYYRGLEAEQREREYSAQDYSANNALAVLEQMSLNENYTDENGILTEEGYKRAKNYLASIDSTLDQATRNILQNQLKAIAPSGETTTSGMKDATGKKITNYDSWNTLSSSKEIRRLPNVKIQGSTWKDETGADMWLTYKNEDGTRHDYKFKFGEKLSGNAYNEVWEYLKNARGRTPQEGDSAVYDGKLVVTLKNGSLRYVEKLMGDGFLSSYGQEFSDFIARLNALD